ncbi:MAG: hypothetical protein M3144_07765 [Actinomycetota bacterium]|nr:hypothetical protein [Actinomycetota bacterium]
MSEAGRRDTSELVEIRIVGMPLDVYRETAEHSDELMREFALIRERDTEDGRAVPRRLLALVEALTSRFTVFTAAQEAQLRQALDRGDATIDLVYRVPADVKQAALELGAMLDEADAFCREGHDLLTLSTPPRAVAFRIWFLDQFVRQIDGLEPTPWHDGS